MEIVIIFILIVITSIITIKFLKLKQDYKLLLSNKNNFINNIEKLKNQIDILKNALYADVKVVVNNKVRNTYSVSSTGGYTSRIREKDKKVLKSGFKVIKVEGGYIKPIDIHRYLIGEKVTIYNN